MVRIMESNGSDIDDMAELAETPVPPFNVPLVELAGNFFCHDGKLSRAQLSGRTYEFRPQQEQMAVAVAEAMKGNYNLCVEAPTGVGKSFAYLQPAIHYAKALSKPVVISTETINLQEQLINKDLPFLRKAMDMEFKTALAKGRSNYLCLRRLFMATSEYQAEFFPLESSRAEAAKILAWSEKTNDGSRSELPFNVDNSVWSGVCCEGGNCRGPKCSYVRECFYWKARKLWEQADVIVANHALFFADLKIKLEGADLESTLLPPYAAVVIDEAHTLEDNAAEHLGLRVAQAGFSHFLRRLFNPRYGSGLLLKPGGDAAKIRESVAEVDSLAHSFFAMIEQTLIDRDSDILRVMRPQIVPDLLSDPLAALQRQLEQYLKSQEDENFRAEIENMLRQCHSYMDAIFKFMNMSLENHVYWIEESKSGEHSSIALRAAPLNVSVLLYQCLFSKDFPVILTSATLSVGNTMDYYRSRVGYGDGAELVLDSPFSPDQVEMHIPRAIPDPTEEEFAPALIEHIKHYIRLTHGKAFVLFTSYQLLKFCAAQLRDFFAELDITLLVQGESLSRGAMLEQFRADIDSVIFGTTSFWTGVDVPGEALSNVIITRLPFPVPSHPLIEARNERILELGGNPFMHYSLPEAILKLRQGVGRLIRGKSDTGIIVVLDKRVLTKRYGSLILGSLPRYHMHVS